LSRQGSARAENAPSYSGEILRQRALQRTELPLSPLPQPQAITAAVTSTTLRWWVVHTLPRQEKALAEDLAKLNIEYFLPLQHSVRYYGKRKFKVDEPLFSGYLFVNGSHEQAIQADRTGRVASLISVADQARLAGELQTIRTVLEQGGELSVARLIKVGDTVEIKAGPFKGIRGVVDRSGPRGRLLLGIHLIERAAVLEIEYTLLERVDDQAV